MVGKMKLLAALALFGVVTPARAQEGLVQVGGMSTSPDFYTVQAGDTLWDISTRFLGDAYQWPQLWSYNEYITNPHWIYPGNRIYFRLGDQLTMPAAGIIDAIEDVPYQPPAATVATAEEGCDFPPSFDRTQRGMRLSAPALLGNPDDFGSIGKVLWASAPGANMGEGAYLNVRVDRNSDIECGQIMGLYRKVSTRIRGGRGAGGNVYRNVASVRILRIDENVATAVIRDSYVEVRRGDLMGDAMATDVTLDIEAPHGDVEAEIIARMNQEAVLMGTFETVFLNRGTRDGLDVGTALYVVTRKDGNSGIQSRDDKRLPERVRGRVVVVRADETSATAVIVDAAEELTVGSMVVGEPNRVRN